VPVPGPDLIDRGLVGVEGHQVGVLTTYLPTSIVSVDRWGVPYGAAQFLVGGPPQCPWPGARRPCGGDAQDRPG
jgi:hypothetical protein